MRSFLGLVGFNSRFIPNLATTAEPLRSLTRHNTPFVWTDKQETAFKTLKEQLASAPALAYFDKTAPTKVIADASPVGLGAVLLQEQDGIDRPVYSASRSLSPVERRYSQTEREALTLVWACKRFHLHLFGLPEFVLVTDHKALELIYSPARSPQHGLRDGCFGSNLTDSTYSSFRRLRTLRTPCPDSYRRATQAHQLRTNTRSWSQRTPFRLHSMPAISRRHRPQTPSSPTYADALRLMTGRTRRRRTSSCATNLRTSAS